MMVERILSIFCLFLIVLSSETRLLEKTNFLSAFASDASRQLNILRHDRDSLGVDRAQVGVFEQANQVRFGRFL